MTNRMVLALVMLVANVHPALGQDRAVRYEFGDRADVRIVTDAVVTDPGARSWRHPLAPGSRGADARAVDGATGKPLSARVEGWDVVVDFGRQLPARAEQRVRIEEIAARREYVKGQGQDAKLVFEQRVHGRVTVVLPPGYSVTKSSVPAQYAIEEGRLKAGVLALDTPVILRLEAEVGPSAPTAALSGSFRAEDDRTIVYWLEDPASQRIRLALEMLLTKPGQSHAYSVLRKDDHISDPVTLDVDRGVELPTRIVSGQEATAIGDSPTPFPADASVLMADLGYSLEPGASARVRLYQIAIDKEGYRLGPDGQLQWSRFLARLRTRAVLPPGWFLTSVDQPAVVSRDDQGRVVLDFVQTGGDSPALFLTARKAGGGR